MEKKTKEANIVLIFGIIGIMGVLTTIISDIILLGRPSSAAEFFHHATESMADISHGRITVGTFLGVVALPFQVLGLAPLYYGLKSSGKVLPLVVVLIDAHAILMGVAFHMSYTFMGRGWRFYHESGLDQNIVSGLLDRFDDYWGLLILIIAIELLCSTIIYIIVILKRKSFFPKWMVLVNPIVAVLLVLPLIYILPSPIGGYIGPTVLNLATLIFIAVTMLLFSKKRTCS
ncbi:MAG TPA: DUF6796 family protein [Mobilitalea sp.]|nr:DUF6796 family protein [Mobilitalea sp.]